MDTDIASLGCGHHGIEGDSWHVGNSEALVGPKLHFQG